MDRILEHRQHERARPDELAIVARHGGRSLVDVLDGEGGADGGS